MTVTHPDADLAGQARRTAAAFREAFGVAPTFAAAPIIIGLLIFNFPNGRPMKPAPPRLLDGDGL